MPVTNRWLMAVAGVCLQMALGAAYAWSVFRIPLAKEFGWTHLPNHLDISDQLVFPGLRRHRRRLVDEARRARKLWP